MRTEQARPHRLVDYRTPDWLVETVELDVSFTRRRRACAQLWHSSPNPQAEAPAPLMLDGDELQLTWLKLDGQLLAADAYSATPDGLTIPAAAAAQFRARDRDGDEPSANTQLMAVPVERTYCTQCEAEGFRRITYSPTGPT